ncbi:12545_t:CDS:2 [Funneliformis geosporum]|uniref:11323_t:CDS:1 n=1 Tax=Funneliformis geosporum TaxID=1117311 RepID=A0A9W4SAV1_9GLOM|nr:12545_t:CDS:2 [Funneliformis geosporum]CAI2163075.1 11323_t:CDS:2 [Funneliformis geosporum]
MTAIYTTMIESRDTIILWKDYTILINYRAERYIKTDELAMDVRGTAILEGIPVRNMFEFGTHDLNGGPLNIQGTVSLTLN